MKKELINLVKILGIGYQEIVVDIDLGFFIINSVEFREPNDIILHHFDENDVDIEISFDDIENKYKKEIINFMNGLLYN